MKRVTIVLCVTALFQVTLQAQTPPADISHSAISGLNPLPISRDQLTVAVRAQERPNTKVLQQAWNYYQQWQGTWQPNHVKPTPAEKKEVESFTENLLQKLPVLASAEKLGQQSVDLDRFKDSIKVGSQDFKSCTQTEGTQTLKALVLMGLTEHELDIPDGVKIAHPLLMKLLARTPIDPDLYSLYARLSLDARQNPAAWQAVRIATFLRPDPTDSDLEFLCFVGSIAAKDQRPAIKLMLREVAHDPAQIERVVARTEILFTDKAKSIFTPLGAQPKLP
jgi:hypothetical protein